jgi:hypothetical protein
VLTAFCALAVMSLVGCDSGGRDDGGDDYNQPVPVPISVSIEPADAGGLTYDGFYFLHRLSGPTSGDLEPDARGAWSVTLEESIGASVSIFVNEASETGARVVIVSDGEEEVNLVVAPGQDTQVHYYVPGPND